MLNMNKLQADYCDDFQNGKLPVADINCSALGWYDIIGLRGAKTLESASRAVVMSHIETYEILNRMIKQ